jgi:hypothetical protein
MNEYPLWRLWLSKGIPLQELRWNWTYPDILKANAVLDFQDDYELAIDGVTQPEV